MKKQIRILLALCLASLFLTRVAVAAPPAALSADQLKTKFSSAKVTVVNLWATWCGPCQEEMPELVRFRKDHPGLQLILVSADSNDDLPKVDTFLTGLKVDFPTFHLAGEPDAFITPFVKDWPATVPTTLVFDSTGKRIGYWLGRIKFKELEAAVAPKLDPKLNSKKKG